jgi:hypothetical protein
MYASQVLRAKTAFWGGAVHGLMGIPFAAGQRAAVEQSPRQLTDAQYDQVTGGFAPAAAAAPRAIGEGLLGAAIGGGLGLGAGLGLDAMATDGSASVPFDVPDLGPSAAGSAGLLAGGAAGLLGGVAHGTYASARNGTTESIEHLGDGSTIASRHPVLTGLGGANAVLSAALNPLAVPVQAALGGIGHGFEHLRGRAVSRV